MEKSAMQKAVSADELLQIELQIFAISQAIERSEGEITVEVEDLLKHLSEKLKNITDAYGYLLKRLEVERAFYKREAEFYSEKAKKASVGIERVKEKLKASMLNSGAKSIEGDRWGFSLKRGRQKCGIDESKFPNALEEPSLWTVKTEYSINKSAVLGCLMAGQMIPGAWLEDVYALTPKDKIKVFDVKEMSNDGND